MSFRHIVAASTIAALLAGCGAKNSPQMVPAQSSRSMQSNGQGNGEVAPVASSTRLTFSSVGASQAQTFTVSVQYAGDLTATSLDPNIATVGPGTATPTVTQNDDGTKSATFTVTPVWFGTTRITITDKKGSTATITVVVNDGVNFN